MNEDLRTQQHRPGMITVESAAYAAVGMLALVLRLYQLGLRPLNGSEAAQALAAYRFTQGAAQTVPAGTIPVLFTGSVAGFTLMGASDVTARWLPALAGLILVLLPYWLRHRLGRGGALAASLLLALSPTAIYFSRSLDSAIVVAACGLALAVGLINYLDSRRPGPLFAAAVALGLGLCAGAGTYTLLLIFSAFALFLYLSDRLLDRKRGWSSLKVAWGALRDEKGLLRRVGVVLGASFGLGATALVLHPGGLGHAADLLGVWFQSFLPEAGGQPLIYPLMLLLRYESLILLLGLVEACWTVLRRRGDPGWRAPGSSFPHTAFLTFWAVAATVIVLLSGHRPAGNLLLLVVPVALLAGQGIERAWRWISQRALWPYAGLAGGVALCLLTFFYLEVAAYGQASPHTTISAGPLTLYTTSTHLLVASVALLLMVGLGIAVWVWRGPEVVLTGGWLAVLVALGFFGFKGAWGISVARAADPRELMIMQTTAPEVRELVDELERLSVDSAGDAHTAPITIDAATGPVIAWYLREFKDQTIVEGLSTPPDTAVAITLVMQDPPIGETFRGRSFPLRTHWLPWSLWGQELARWLLLTDGDLPIVDQQVVLWVAAQP